MTGLVVIGATGTIGRRLCAALQRRGTTLVVFSRDPDRAKLILPEAEAYAAWQVGPLSPECVEHLRCADAVVYLAGGPLFDGRRHTRHDIEQESADRIQGINAVVHALAGLDRRPATMLVASSVGYYGYGTPTDAEIAETAPRGPDWWAACSAAIEEAALAATDLGIRAVVLRSGYVLTPESLHSQVRQFGHYRGGWIGTGRSWTPWIHIDDEVGILINALDRADLTGPFNATAPEPVRAREFARTLGEILGHRAWLPVPTPFVRMGLGAVTDILTKGKRVVPAAALAHGHSFNYPTLDTALRDLLTAPPPAGHRPTPKRTP